MSLNMESAHNPQPPVSWECTGQGWVLENKPTGSPRPGWWGYTASSVGLWGQNMGPAICFENSHSCKISILGFYNNVCKILVPENCKWQIKYWRYKAWFIQMWARDHQWTNWLVRWSKCRLPGSSCPVKSEPVRARVCVRTHGGGEKETVLPSPHFSIGTLDVSSKVWSTFDYV